MIVRRSAYYIIFILSSILNAVSAISQPTLPDISGTYENGSVLLKWNCQYSGIKAISVLRSKDSLYDYEIAGYVKNMNKGIQSFEDTHPPAGKNYYKLAIIFKSGLTWRSNHFGIVIPENKMTAREPHMPVNNARIEKESAMSFAKGKRDNCPPLPGRTTRPTVSLTEDTAQKSVTPHADNINPTRPKIVLKSESQPDIENPVVIKSRFVFIDPATGHVDLFLPDDVAGHHYSIKFYDHQNHIIFELARINTPRIIFDKRNFHRKGTYRFVLRRDYTELESGYIITNP